MVGRDPRLSSVDLKSYSLRRRRARIFIGTHRVILCGYPNRKNAFDGYLRAENKCPP